MMMCGNAPIWYGGGVLMSVAVVIFWALVITGAVLVFRYLISSARGTAANATPALPGDAEKALALRYARGEIDDAEYQRRSALLHQNH
jgi:putative membrane protein